MTLAFPKTYSKCNINTRGLHNNVSIVSRYTTNTITDLQTIPDNQKNKHPPTPPHLPHPWLEPNKAPHDLALKTMHAVINRHCHKHATNLEN